MVKFLIDNDIPAHDMLTRRNQHARKIMNIPFTSESKMMIVIREIVNDDQNVRVYVKGAPELIIPKCERFYDKQFHLSAFNEQEHILDNLVHDMAQRGHKVLTYGYREISTEDLENLLEVYKENLENPGFKQELMNDLIYLATFGLEDPIRNTV